MHPRSYIRLFASLIACTPMVVLHAGDAAPADAQSEVPSWLVGTWMLVRCDNVYPDGHRTALYGPKPQGLWIVDAHGNYMMDIARDSRVPFASADKSTGTAQEYRAASLDFNAHFGSIGLQNGQLVSHVQKASFPNWEGHALATAYRLQGDHLTYIVAKPTTGAQQGAHGEVEWLRLH